jgi:hypothetical protein
MWFTLEPRELKTMAAVLQELGLSYEETIEVMKGVSKDMIHTKDLWWDNRKSKLIKLACALITFPEPTPISESIGAAVLALGLIQKRIKKSALHVDDVYQTYREINKNLLKIRQNII